MTAKGSGRTYRMIEQVVNLAARPFGLAPHSVIVTYGSNHTSDIKTVLLSISAALGIPSHLINRNVSIAEFDYIDLKSYAHATQRLMNHSDFLNMRIIHGRQVRSSEGYALFIDHMVAECVSLSLRQRLTNMLRAQHAWDAPTSQPVSPKIGTKWTHSNGAVYTVESITNIDSTNQARYPTTVVYRGTNDKLWSRPLSDWHRSMTWKSDDFE